MGFHVPVGMHARRRRREHRGGEHDGEPNAGFEHDVKRLEDASGTGDESGGFAAMSGR
jgi:hypothetical protein